MSKPPRVDRPVVKNLSLPESVVARVSLHLFSEVEGKVPFGAFSKYIQGLVEADLARREAAMAAKGTSK